MEITTIDAICLGLVILIGLPHGAFDGPLLIKAKGFHNNDNTKIFYYVTVGIAFWFFWGYLINCFKNIFENILENIFENILKNILKIFF